MPPNNFPYPNSAYPKNANILTDEQKAYFNNFVDHVLGNGSFEFRVSKFCNFIETAVKQEQQQQEVYRIVKNLFRESFNSHNPLQDRSHFQLTIALHYIESTNKFTSFLNDVIPQLTDKHLLDTQIQYTNALKTVRGVAVDSSFYNNPQKYLKQLQRAASDDSATDIGKFTPLQRLLADPKAFLRIAKLDNERIRMSDCRKIIIDCIDRNVQRMVGAFPEGSKLGWSKQIALAHHMISENAAQGIIAPPYMSLHEESEPLIGGHNPSPQSGNPAVNSHTSHQGLPYANHTAMTIASILSASRGGGGNLPITNGSNNQSSRAAGRTNTDTDTTNTRAIGMNMPGLASEPPSVMRSPSTPAYSTATIARNIFSAGGEYSRINVQVALPSSGGRSFAERSPSNRQNANSPSAPAPDPSGRRI